MGTEGVITREWAPGERLQPWALYDLERLAAVVEYRVSDLTPEEREMVRNAINRMAHALTVWEG